MSKNETKKAGSNTWVRAREMGYYEGQRRRPDDDAFRLREGDGIVSWMEEVEAPKTLAATKRGKNEPRNQPEPTKPNGDQQPGDETGNAKLPSTAQSPDQLPADLA